MAQFPARQCYHMEQARHHVKTMLTIAYLIDLGIGPLDPVKGGDDAASAKWLALNDLRPEDSFEDHWAIVQNLVGAI